MDCEETQKAMIHVPQAYVTALDYYNADRLVNMRRTASYKRGQHG